jgi:hypothetical protein
MMMSFFMDCWFRAIFLTVLECATGALDVGPEICAFFCESARRNEHHVLSCAYYYAQIMCKTKSLVGPQPEATNQEKQPAYVNLVSRIIRIAFDSSASKLFV